eukprot:m.898157 g.898157  ORF g.898157 m.898157 type:complete len:1720 (+) comp60023_c0_seq1:2500-7659(+)
MQRYYQRLLRAAVSVQKNFRAFAARRRFCALRTAAIVLQLAWRARAVRVHEERLSLCYFSRWKLRVKRSVRFRVQAVQRIEGWYLRVKSAQQQARHALDLEAQLQARLEASIAHSESLALGADQPQHRPTETTDPLEPTARVVSALGEMNLAGRRATLPANIAKPGLSRPPQASREASGTRFSPSPLLSTLVASLLPPDAKITALFSRAHKQETSSPSPTLTRSSASYLVKLRPPRIISAKDIQLTGNYPEFSSDKTSNPLGINRSHSRESREFDMLYGEYGEQIRLETDATSRSELVPSRAVSFDDKLPQGRPSSRAHQDMYSFFLEDANESLQLKHMASATDSLEWSKVRDSSVAFQQSLLAEDVQQLVKQTGVAPQFDKVEAARIPPLPISIHSQDKYLGATNKYRAEALLQDSRNDYSDSIWALPSGIVEQGFVLDLGRTTKVSRIDIKNSGNNEFGFERGVKGFAIALSTDGELWTVVCKSRLPSERGADANDRLQLTRGFKQIPWHTEHIPATEAHYLRLTVESYYGKGAALNAIRVFDAEAAAELKSFQQPHRAQEPAGASRDLLAHDLRELVVDSLDKINQIERFFSEYAIALRTTATLQERVYAGAVKQFHRTLVGVYHLLMTGTAASASFAKRGDQLLASFLAILAVELNKEGDLLPTEAASVQANCTSLFRELLFRFHSSQLLNEVPAMRSRADTNARLSRMLSHHQSSRDSQQTRVEVIRVQAHVFARTEFEVSTVCERCHGLLWMLEMGYVCRKCKFAAHKACVRQCEAPCQRRANKEKLPRLPHQKPKYFGEPLTSLLRQEHRKVPLILETCVRLIEQSDESLGNLYRKLADVHAVKALKQRIDAGDISCLEREKLTSVSSILKVFFRELPEPLMTYDAYNHLLNALQVIDDDGRIDALLVHCSALPEANRASLELLLFHLAWVAQHVTITKMDAHSLAIVFGPILLRCPPHFPSMRALTDVPRQAEVLRELLESQMERIDATWKDVETVALAIKALRKLSHAERIQQRSTLSGSLGTIPNARDRAVASVLRFLDDPRLPVLDNLRTKIDHLEEQRINLIGDLPSLVRYRSSHLVDQLRDALDGTQTGPSPFVLDLAMASGINLSASSNTDGDDLDDISAMEHRSRLPAVAEAYGEAPSQPGQLQRQHHESAWDALISQNADLLNISTSQEVSLGSVSREEAEAVYEEPQVIRGGRRTSSPPPTHSEAQYEVPVVWDSTESGPASSAGTPVSSVASDWDQMLSLAAAPVRKVSTPSKLGAQASASFDAAPSGSDTPDWDALLSLASSPVARTSEQRASLDSRSAPSTRAGSQSAEPGEVSWDDLMLLAKSPTAPLSRQSQSPQTGSAPGSPVLHPPSVPPRPSRQSTLSTLVPTSVLASTQDTSSIRQMSPSSRAASSPRERLPSISDQDELDAPGTPDRSFHARPSSLKIVDVAATLDQALAAASSLPPVSPRNSSNSDSSRSKTSPDPSRANSIDASQSHSRSASGRKYQSSGLELGSSVRSSESESAGAHTKPRSLSRTPSSELVLAPPSPRRSVETVTTASIPSPSTSSGPTDLLASRQRRSTMALELPSDMLTLRRDENRGGPAPGDRFASQPAPASSPYALRGASFSTRSPEFPHQRSTEGLVYSLAAQSRASLLAASARSPAFEDSRESAPSLPNHSTEAQSVPAVAQTFSPRRSISQAVAAAFRRRFSSSSGAGSNL